MTEISVNSLGLSVRATNALNRMEIHTLGDLINTPIEIIEQGRNIGAKTIEEIRGFIVGYLDGQIDIDSIIDGASPMDNQKRVFTEDEIEEMSKVSIKDLHLPIRAENTLLRVGCNKVSELATMSEKDLRELKGLGKKSCDEMLLKLYTWIDDNFPIFSTSDEEEIPDDERNFYIRLTEILLPIKHFYWKQLRTLITQHDQYINIEISDMEIISNDLLFKILNLDEFVPSIRNLFLNMAPSGIIAEEELFEKIDALDLAFDKKIISELLFNGKIITCADDVCYINKPNITEYLDEHVAEIDERNYEMLVRRLRGESLQEIGELYDLSRERVRQILAKTAAKMPYIYEDYYRAPYEYFKLSKEEFCNAFPECGSIGYEYLFVKYKKGNILVNEDTINSYTGLFDKKMKSYWKEECIRQDKKHVTRTEMIYRVLLSNSDRAMSMEEFENEYIAYLERRNYPKERLMINIRTVSNHFRSAPHIVFDRDNRVRYCEADPKTIWDNIDFTRYKDLVISAELIYRDYLELMEEQDIRDGYELFYVIKSSLENWENSKFEINCRRVPVMVLGNGDEARQALQLLKEISPIDFFSYYEAYEERFGVRSANGNPIITGALANFYLDGEYSIDVVAINDEDAICLKDALSRKSFWFIDEVEKLFHEICIHSSEDAFNKAAFKRIGYSLNIGYLYDDEYGTVVNYFDQEIFSKPILDLKEYDRRLLGLSALGSALYKKRMDLEYIEVAPKVYMTISELERLYGISIDDIRELQDWICKCEHKYFNAHSVWERLHAEELDKKLQDNEWLCTCIFRQQSTIFSLQVAGGIILCKDSNELNLGLICQWLVEKNGKMTVQNLTTKFNETFATKIPVSKIAEKVKAYGLWDVLVTDSFDEYIDNLVVSAETDMDDLLQEEFF